MKLPPFSVWRRQPEIMKLYPFGQRAKARKDYNRIREEMKKEEEMNLVGASSFTAYVDCPQFSFADCPAPQPSIAKYFDGGIPKQEGINPMNYATATVQAATTETQDQRKYLEKRLQEVYYEKRDPLDAKFGLTDDDAPRTGTELIERLKEGKYTIKTDRDYWCWFDMIQWRSPDRKQDHDGYKAAIDDLKALRQKSLDIIKIEEPKAGLDAVKALEAWEPTGAAN